MDSDDEGPPIVKAKRRRKPINKRTKLHLVFNEEARRDFLTGFRKRKLQRKKKAQEELQELLKAERKRIKLEAKDQYKKLVHSYKPIPELEEQFAKEYDVEDTTVSVLELDTDLLAETNFLIGRNRGQNDDTEVKDEDEEDEVEEETEEMPGMELKVKQPEKIKKFAKKPPEEKVFKTKKEIKKDLKKQSTKSVKKSKVFQKLNEIHTLKQKKKASIKRRDAKKSQSRGKKSKRSKFKKKK